MFKLPRISFLRSTNKWASMQLKIWSCILFHRDGGGNIWYLEIIAHVLLSHSFIYPAKVYQVPLGAVSWASYWGCYTQKVFLRLWVCPFHTGYLLSPQRHWVSTVKCSQLPPTYLNHTKNISKQTVKRSEVLHNVVMEWKDKGNRIWTRIANCQPVLSKDH